MGAEKAEAMGLRELHQTNNDVSAPQCFDNAAHALQQANSGDEIDYGRVALATEWRLLGGAVHQRDVQRHDSGLR